MLKRVITAKDVQSVYEIPLVFAEQGVDETILRLLHMDAGPRNLSRWIEMVDRMKNPAARSQHRAGRQICRVRGFLQEPERSAAACRHRAPGARQHRVD